jgi:hypothetical protein
MSATLYENDFYAWTLDQAERLRAMAGDNRIDAELLAEEIEDLGKSEVRTVKSYVARILEHFLKIEYSGSSEPQRHWENEIRVFRLELQDYLTRTLRAKVEADIGRCFAIARTRAKDSLRKNADGTEPHLPEDCPYTLDRVLDPDWFPEPRRD